MTAPAVTEGTLTAAPTAETAGHVPERTLGTLPE
jgi:hypothetical protein